VGSPTDLDLGWPDPVEEQLPERGVPGLEPLDEQGISWQSVVNDMKFARAVERLEAGGGSVREIAEELGYTDAAHFTRFFRGRAGVPPSTYREEIGRARELACRGPS
jgi:hypothetical protein